MMFPEPQAKNSSVLLANIDQGQIKIPQFQRKFVWELKKCADLMDSIIKGYPIGTLIFWRTKERLRSVRNIGGYDLPEPPDGDFVEYVLDGQQRLTALYASFKAGQVPQDGHTDDFSQMWVDLDAKEDEQIVLTNALEGKGHVIQLKDLLNLPISLLAEYPSQYHKKLDNYRQRFKSYSYSTIQVKDASLDVATEIFSRINTKGKALTLFEIMVAKTFEPKRDFDLAQKFDDLVQDLGASQYETIADMTVLQTVALLIGDECKRQTILRLDKKAFIDMWPAAVDGIELAVDYLRNSFRIPVSQLLPYNSLIVPLAYFFHHHPGTPSQQQAEYLRDFFWRCSLSGRYSSGVEGKLAQDVKLRIERILKQELPDYDWGIDTSPEFIERNGWFSAGRSYVKAILCVYAFQQPRSFNGQALVNISNDWLKQANSKNYHHFFPKAYLKKVGIDDKKANNILNITIIDDFLNKKELKAQAPAVYMRRFADNKELADTMRSHFIFDLDKFGVWNNDYNAFLHERSKAVSAALRQRIIARDIDAKGQPELVDDYDAASSDMADSEK